MATIKLADAAKFDQQLPHQLAAWNGLQATLTAKQLEDFAETFRAAGTGARDPFRPNSGFDYQLTPNVSYGELCLQSPERRFHQQHQCETGMVLAQFVQKARDTFNCPAVITSAYRPPRINTAVGGAINSEHLYDTPSTGAIDFYLDGMPVKELQDWADRAWSYSLGLGAPKGFIHIGIRPGHPRIRWNY
jgi:hypothetical protein